MHNRKDQFRTEGFIIGALVGAAVAALASLLFAPKSGRELRDDIGKGTNKALDQADQYLDTARQRGHEVVEDVEEKASKYFSVASDEVDKATSKTKGLFNKKAKQVEDKVDEVAKDLNN